MKHIRENMLVQFSIISFVIVLILAVTLSTVVTRNLNNNISLLEDHGTAMMSGNMIAPSAPHSIQSLASDVGSLKNLIYGLLGSGFALLFVGLVSIVWRGSRTIERQQSELLKANASMQQTNDDLVSAQGRLMRAEKLAAIGELSAGVAHELRNPLGAINNAVYYIKDKLSGSDVIKDYPRVGQFVDVMEEEIQSSNKIITDLMDFVRIRPPDIAPVQLDTLITRAIERAGLKDDINVITEIPSAPVKVWVDQDQIGRVLLNLIQNADNAMPGGGEIKIRAKAGDGSVELEVSDTGHGIDEENLPNIFEPLFTTRAKGIGLGLAIVNEFVRRHEGTIDVTSKPDVGTTFIIRLPVKSEIEDEGKVLQEQLNERA